MSAQAPLQDGDPPRVGEYEILGRLGVGGMGIVYLARAGSGRMVALKVVHAALAHDEDFRRRFRSEVASVRRVPPFCTAEVLDADTDADQPYLVVEFVDGPTLSDEVKGKGPLTPANLHQVAVGIATALTVIHEAGVIHRDLKPGNVLLAPGGLKVIDFGIARAMQSSTQYTRTDQIFGTINYMAPERFDAPGRPLTPAADIFAWGCVVAFAGTGRGPFDADSPAATLGRILGKPPMLDGLEQGPLRRLVEQALVLDPAARPTARDLLTTLLSGAPVSPVESAAVSAAAAVPVSPVGSVSASPAGSVSASPVAVVSALPTGSVSADSPVRPVPSGPSVPAVPSPGARRGRAVPVLAAAVIFLVLVLIGGVGFVVFRDTAQDEPATAASSLVTTAAGEVVPSVAPSAGPSASASTSPSAGAAAHTATKKATKSATKKPSTAATAATAGNQPPIKAAGIAGASAFGPYFVYNHTTGMCVDLDGTGAGAVNQPVLEDTCQKVTDDNQEFEFVPHIVTSSGDEGYWIRNTDDSLCLDVDGTGSVATGADVVEMICNDNDNQDYRLKTRFTDGGRQYYHLINTASGLCLDVYGNGGPAVHLTLATCADNDDHEWALVKRSDW